MNKQAASLLLLFPLLVGVPTVAHHSDASYETGQRMQITGTVKKWQWTNPHSFLWLIVDDGKGGTDEAGFELGSPNTLIRNGFTSKTFVPGDKATVTYAPRRDGKPGGGLNSVYVYNQGKWLSWGPGAEVQPAAPATAPLK